MSDADLKLYRVVYDEQPFHVEAATMGEAIRIWQADRAKQPKDYGWLGTEEPDQVLIENDHNPVIRAPAPAGALACANGCGRTLDRWECDECPEKCEGCDAPATTRDNDGVPLCQPCADELVAEERRG